MKKNIIIFLCLIILTSCSNEAPKTTPEEKEAKVLEEVRVLSIKLPEKYAGRDMEFSGLSWHEDRLVFLPQYPDDLDSGEYDGLLLYAEKEELASRLDNPTDTSEITLKKLYLKFPEIGNYTGKGSGFEGIAFADTAVFFLTELTGDGGANAWLIKGSVKDSVITVDEEHKAYIKSQTGIFNLGDEAITIVNGMIATFHEANGANVNPEPIANLFTMDLKPMGGADFPNLEYRITDATAEDDSSFWVMNYFYPGDQEQLNPGVDSLVVKYGVGASHKNSAAVERLVKVVFDGQKFRLAGSPPITLDLSGEKDGRNWEGIAYLEGRGFFIVTDRYPGTRFGFIPTKQD